MVFEQWADVLLLKETIMQYKIDSYSDFATEYETWMRKREDDPNIARFLEVIGDVTDLTVLDAGCGEGYLSRKLASRGAHVTGIDISPRLIDIARAKDTKGEITYQVADLSKPLPEDKEHFDLIASFFVLNDVYDYRGFLSTLGMVAKRGARLVLFMNNPYSFVVRGHVKDYFDTGKAFPYRGMAEEGVKVHFYQHTLEEYMDASLSTGFQLQRLIDVPTPEGSFKRRDDTLTPVGYQFPFFMILSFVKA